MIHCCIFYVFSEGAAVQRRNYDVRVSDASWRRNQMTLAIHRRRWATWIQLTAADWSIADQEVTVWAAGGELKWVLIFAGNSGVNFFRIHVVIAWLGNQRCWIGIILKVNKAIVFKRTLSKEEENSFTNLFRIPLAENGRSITHLIRFDGQCLFWGGRGECFIQIVNTRLIRLAIIINCLIMVFLRVRLGQEMLSRAVRR